MSKLGCVTHSRMVLGSIPQCLQPNLSLRPVSQFTKVALDMKHLLNVTHSNR